MSTLELALEGSENVLYFTHDYPSQTSDKNDFLSKTAALSKQLGIKKLIAVTPIESDLYYTEEYEELSDIRSKGIEKALSQNGDMVVLSPNLVFGEYSYFVRYLE